MRKLFTLILFFSLGIGMSIAQDSESLDTSKVAINIVGNYGDFLIDLVRSDGKINIKFQVKDSVDEAKLASDPKYKRGVKAWKKGFNTRNSKNLMAYIEGYKKYTVYSSDPLVVPTDTVITLSKLLTRIASSKNEDLVNKSLTHIDGFDLQLTITGMGISRELSAHSPGDKTSPLLKQLLHHLVLLSKTTKTNLLRRTVINGY